MQAAAAEARYLVTDDRLVLSGREGTTRPRVTDTGVQIEGDEITVGLAANTMAATGEVASVMQPAAAREGAGPARTPALLDSGQAVFASAAALEYDSQQRRGIYTGRARLWQGDTNIRAERILLDEARGDLTAAGGVQSTLAIETATAADPPGGGRRGTIARAEAMAYDDTARTATYTTAARMSGPAGRPGRPTASRWCSPPKAARWNASRATAASWRGSRGATRAGRGSRITPTTAATCSPARRCSSPRTAA